MFQTPGHLWAQVKLRSSHHSLLKIKSILQFLMMNLRQASLETSRKRLAAVSWTVQTLFLIFLPTGQGRLSRALRLNLHSISIFFRDLQVCGHILNVREEVSD